VIDRLLGTPCMYKHGEQRCPEAMGKGGFLQSTQYATMEMW
jgi:hypothetical protein